MICMVQLHKKMEEWNNNPQLYCVRFERQGAIIELPLWPYQARSQKSAMGGCIGGLEAKSPALEDFVFFGKNNLINFSPILIKISVIET